MNMDFGPFGHMCSWSNFLVLIYVLTHYFVVRWLGKRPGFAGQSLASTWRRWVATTRNRTSTGSASKQPSLSGVDIIILLTSLNFSMTVRQNIFELVKNLKKNFFFQLNMLALFYYFVFVLFQAWSCWSAWHPGSENHLWSCLCLSSQVCHFLTSASGRKDLLVY